jgi:hypothetical protein
MWALLTNPGHAEGFVPLGEAYTPLRRLVGQLARREDAGRVYAFQASASFILTTAPSHAEAGGHDRIGVEYLPDRGLFAIGYTTAGAPPTRTARQRTAAVRLCQPAVLGEILDGYVQRLLLARPPARPAMPAGQSALLLVMFAAMLVYLVAWLLLWTGLPVDALAVVSLGIVGITTGLISFGEALFRSWRASAPQRGRRPGVGIGRLSAFGFGLWCVAVGVVYVGGGELSETAVWLFLGTLATAALLVLVGQWSVRSRRARRASNASAPG